MNEIKAILEGKRINKHYTYRVCYLLARYFKSLDYNPIEIRSKILAWSNKYKVCITDDLNSIIQKALADKNDIVKNIEVYISENDVREIIRRFDKYNTRLTAFAILCFAKRYANESGHFCISRIGLSNWVGIAHTHLSSKYIKELIDFDYIHRVKTGSHQFINNKNKLISKSSTYKINVPIGSSGVYVFRDNNIREEFENIFNQSMKVI